MPWIVTDKTSGSVSRAADVLDVLGLLSMKNSVDPRDVVDSLRTSKSFENAEWHVSKEEKKNENVPTRSGPSLSVVRV